MSMMFTRADLFLIERALKNYEHEVRIQGKEATVGEEAVSTLRSKVARTIDMMV